VRTGLPGAGARELAFAATLRAAAPHQRRRHASADSPAAVILRHDDLRMRVRSGRTRRLILFSVDASGSMGARQRMETTKGMVLALLLDAYRKRDQVAMVAFRNDRAALVLPPTNSVELAQRELTILRTGGRTPLAAGIDLGRSVIARAQRAASAIEPVFVLITDGRANSDPAGLDPWRASKRAAEQVRMQGWRCVVVDSEHGHGGPGLARTVAGWLDARYLRLDQIGRRPHRTEAD
jgi:magnesium chelatase subunit D